MIVPEMDVVTTEPTGKATKKKKKKKKLRGDEANRSIQCKVALWPRLCV